MPTRYLPPEMLDYIVDILHDDPQALHNCCFVAKSWVPRTRKHLFAKIGFNSPKDLQSWRKTFPDPSNSPARYTRTLSVKYAKDATVADTVEGGCIPTFSRVVCLELYIHPTSLREISLSSFHQFSPTLKSLHVNTVAFPCTRIFNLALSFPLLEDLSFVCFNLSSSTYDDGYPDAPQAIIPSISPAFTGSLKLVLLRDMEIAARQLLDLPNGLNFRNLNFSWCREGDLQWMKELVVACCDTLESLDVTHLLPDDLTPVSAIDLSEAPKLRDVAFRSSPLSIGWITMALETISRRNQDLQHISIQLYDSKIIYVGADVRKGVGEQTYEEWLDLDRLLVRAWESHSIRPELVCKVMGGKGKNVEGCIGLLLPEVTKRGILDLVELFLP